MRAGQENVRAVDLHPENIWTAGDRQRIGRDSVARTKRDLDGTNNGRFEDSDDASYLVLNAGGAGLGGGLP